MVLLLPPGGQLIGMIGVLEAFDAANRLREHRGRARPYRLTVAGTGTRSTSAAGTTVGTVPVGSVGAVHTLVVGGGLQLAEAASPPEFLVALRELASRAERVVGVCSGAFPLAEVGLLDGRRCTTHWVALESLRRRFPRADVQEDALYCEDDGVYTSAGATAGIDLALHLLRRDEGPRLATLVARMLVVFAERPGGQSQFGSAVELRPSTDATLRGVIAEVVRDPAGDHRVEALARRAGMSPRNFARVFRDQTGETPAAFVTRARVEAAQRALGSSDAGLDQIAEDCGFGTPATFRRSFRRVTGVSPGAWRQRFRMT